MTGNIVLLGLAIARHSLTLASGLPGHAARAAGRTVAKGLTETLPDSGGAGLAVRLMTASPRRTGGSLHPCR